MDVFNISDVLFFRRSTHQVHYASHDNVGNRRFQVFLDIYRPAFHDAQVRRDEGECDRIISTIIDTICRKCVPNGRFFEQRGSDWHNLGDGLEARFLVREGLCNHISQPISVFEKKNDDKEALKQAKIIAAKKARAVKAANEARARANVNLKDERFIVENVDPIISTKRQRPSMTAAVSDDTEQQESSPSPSQATPVPDIQPAKKTKQVRPTISSSELRLTDILCGPIGILPIANVGNNRFNVVVDMMKQKYDSSFDPRTKNQIICDIVDVMYQFNPPGRFVRQDSVSELWYELSVEEAHEQTALAFGGMVKEEDLLWSLDVTAETKPSSSNEKSKDQKKQDKDEKVLQEMAMKHAQEIYENKKKGHKPVLLGSRAA